MQVSYKQTLSWQQKIFVDCRTEEEYREATIPGAINLPVFTEEERTELSKIYNSGETRRAKLLGVKYASPRLYQYLSRLEELAQQYEKVILFCARGGLRSECLYRTGDMIGIDLDKLENGYKDYRHFVLDSLENYQLSSQLIVLHGHTGAGKTDTLEKLKARGHPTLNLEELANHRGSVFGSIGLGEPHNQKYFDSLLLDRLQELKTEYEENYIFTEAESKRIGYSVLPDFLLKEMEAGQHVLLKAPLDCRVERIFSEYAAQTEMNTPQFKATLRDSLAGIEKYVKQNAGNEGYEKIIRLVEEEKWQELIRQLLVNYYDHFYSFAQKQQSQFAATISGCRAEEFTDRIEAELLS